MRCAVPTLRDGLFTDQKWINFAPVFFDGVAIVKSSRHNVATWNLTTRTLTGSLEAGFEVDGAPLGFYHFTGFDSGAHRIMAVKNAAASTAVQELIAWYERETEVAAGDPVSRTPWAFGSYSDATPIENWQRALYRDREDLRETFPDPYDAAPAQRSFRAWCATEGRLLRARYDRRVVAKTAARRLTVDGVTSLRLLRLAASPRAGHALRERGYSILRTEGLAGIARRLGRWRGQGLAMIDVIVPVFRGLDATQRCLASVLAHPQRAASDVVVIDDASPEPGIAAWLDELAAQQRIELLRNRKQPGLRAFGQPRARSASRSRRGAPQQRYRSCERLARPPAGLRLPHAGHRHGDAIFQ